MSRNKDSVAVSAVFDYLAKQNRPYSAVDIFNNLHKEHGKTAIVRALEDLAVSKKIIEKTYGKQKIYYINQNNFPDPDDASLKQMDEDITRCATTLQQLVQVSKSREAELHALASTLTTEEAEAKLKAVEKEVSVVEAKLGQLRSGSKLVSPEEKQKIHLEYEKFSTAWKRRKRLATNMIDAILEGYPKAKKVLLEEVGIETDEDVNVSVIP